MDIVLCSSFAVLVLLGFEGVCICRICLNVSATGVFATPQNCYESLVPFSPRTNDCETKDVWCGCVEGTIIQGAVGCVAWYYENVCIKGWG